MIINVNQPDILSLSISILSLCIAAFTIYATMLKKGNIEFRVINKVTKYETRHTNISIAICAINTGASTLFATDINWNIPGTSNYNFKVTDIPQFSDDDNKIAILNPYQQKIKNIEVRIDSTKGYRHSKEINQDCLKENYYIILNYYTLKGNRLVFKELKLDITATIHNLLKADI